MHDQRSQIDELFHDASREAEKEPVEGNWDDLKGKLFNGKSLRNKIILWSSVVIFISAITAVTVIYLNTSNQKTPSVDNNKINTLLSNALKQQSTQAQEDSLHNNTQNQQKEIQNTNILATAKSIALVQNDNRNSPACYKVQVGSFKNKPDEKFFAKLGGNIIEEEKDGYHKYYAGVYSNPADAVNKINELKALGYGNAFVSADHNPVNTNNTAVSDNGETAKTTQTVTAKADNSQTSSFNNPQSKAQTDAVTTIIKRNNADSIDKNKSITSNATVKTVADTAKPKNNTASVNNPPPKPVITFKKWGIGLSLSYDINNYRLQGNNDYGKALIDSSSGKLKGSNSFLYSIGVQATYRFSEKLSVEAGVLYSQKKRLFVSGITYGNTYNYTFNYNGKYFDLPIRARYYFLNVPVKLYATAGVLLSSNFPVKNKGYFKLKNPQDSGYYEMVTIQPASIGVSMQVGAGVEYMLKNKMRLYFSPIYNYSFSPVLKNPTYNNEPVKHFINGFNIAAGCYFDL